MDVCFKVLTVLVWQLPAWAVSTELHKLLNESLWYSRYVAPLNWLDFDTSRRESSLLSNKDGLSAFGGSQSPGWMEVWTSRVDLSTSQEIEFRWISVNINSKYILFFSPFSLQVETALISSHETWHRLFALHVSSNSQKWVCTVIVYFCKGAGFFSFFFFLKEGLIANSSV